MKGLRKGTAFAAVLALLFTVVLPLPALAAITSAESADWRPLKEDAVLAVGQSISDLSVQVKSNDAAADFGSGQSLGFIYPEYNSPTPIRTPAVLLDRQGNAVTDPQNNTVYTLSATAPLVFAHQDVAARIAAASGSAADETQAITGLNCDRSVTVYDLENSEDTYPWTHEVSVRIDEAYTVKVPTDIRWGTDAHHYLGEPTFTALADNASEPTYAWTVESVDGASPAGGTELSANGITAENETAIAPTLTFENPGVYVLLCTATNFLESVGGDTVLTGSDAPHLTLTFRVRSAKISPDEQTLIQNGRPGEPIEVSAVPSSAAEEITGYWTVVDPEGGQLDEAALKEQLSVEVGPGSLGSASEGGALTSIEGIVPTSAASLGADGYTFTWTGTGDYADIGPLVSKVYVVAPQMRIACDDQAFTEAEITQDTEPFTLTAQIAVPGEETDFLDAPYGGWRIANAAGVPGSESTDYAAQLGITDMNALRMVSITIDPAAFSANVVTGTPYVLTFTYADWTVSAQITVEGPPKTGTLQITSDALNGTVVADGAATTTFVPKVFGLIESGDWSDWADGTWTLPEGTTAQQWGIRDAALDKIGAITIAPIADLLVNQPEGGYTFTYSAEIDGKLTKAAIAIKLVKEHSASSLLVPGNGSPITISIDGGVRYACGVTVSKDGITAAAYLQEFAMTNLEDGWSLQIADEDGQPLAEDAVAGTGCVLQLLQDGDAEAAESAVIVITGDVLGTGVMDLAQLIRMAQGFTGTEPLEGAFAMAADFDGNGRVDITDLVREAKLLKTEARRG